MIETACLEKCCPFSFQENWERMLVPGEKARLLDKRTNLQYRDVPGSTISILSGTLLAAAPFYMVGMIGISLMRIVVRVSQACLDALPSLAAQHLAWGVWDILKAPFYTAGLMGCAALGIFVPSEGRRHFARVENHWHGGVSYQQDIRRKDSDELCNLFWKALKDPQEPSVLYLAYCFQPLN